MVHVKSVAFALLELAWVLTGATQYDNCTGDLSWLGDGYCDASMNIPACEYDGGDCCECTCLEGSNYPCGHNGFECNDTTCLNPDLQAEFPYCDGNLLLWNDGECDSENNIASCGYDGGDCCLCTCVANGGCFVSSLDCVDPSVEEELYQCKPPPPTAPPCAAETQRTWVVDNSVEARALTEAVNCSGGTFYVLWKGSITVETTIYVTNGTVLNITGSRGSSVAVMDGGLNVQLLTVIDASLHVSDVYFSSGSSVVGGAITVASSNVTLTRTSFFGSRASGLGGALYVTNNSCVLFDGDETSFLNNSAVGFGGALYASGSSSVHFSGEKVYHLHNTAGIGGGAMAIDQSKFWGEGKTLFKNNTGGYAGGAMNVAHGSTAVWIGNLLFKDNRATFGGALAVYLDSNVSWNGSASFEYNQATLDAGAIHVEGADVSWVGNTRFTSNAALYGGALSATSAAVVSWSGVSSFVNNLSEQAGAVYLFNGSSMQWDGRNTTFSSNAATVRSGGAISIVESHLSWCGNTTFEYNEAENSGGALFISNADVSWSGNTTFVYNQARKSGGAVDIVGADVSWNGNTEFSSNIATNVEGGAAGALMVSAATNVSWSGETSFLNNSASIGGAMYLLTGSYVSWSGPNTTFVSNTATSTLGGATYVSGSKLSWKGATVMENNRAKLSGGAICVSGAYLSWKSSSTSASNTASIASETNDNQTVVSVAEVSWSGTTVFVKNSAQIGGAISVLRGSNVSWSGPNTTFSRNIATFGIGGAVSVNGNLSWSGATTFRDNSASTFGGGVISWDSGIIAWSGDTTFVANNAKAGGAMFVYLNGSVRWTGRTTFASNRAETEGGAIGTYPLDATADAELISFLSIAGPTAFVENTCERDGGAMFLTGGLLVDFDFAVNVTFWHNSARASGGAIFMSDTDVGLIFPGVSFISNSAQLGGAVYSTSSGNARVGFDGIVEPNPTTFYKCSFVGNTAVATGGAIQSAAGEDFINETTFVGNTARVGGALFLAGTTIFFNCSFVDNVADEGAGPAISNIGYVQSMRNSSFFGNDFSCAPGTYRAYNKSDNQYKVFCVDCDASCQGCRFEDPPRVPYCEVAMTHSTSHGSSTTIQSFFIDPGYWRATVTSKNILACYHPNACRGGVTGTSGFCSEGYEGPYCAICSDGYTEGLGFTCNKCSNTTIGVALMVVVFAVVIVVIVFLVLYVISGELEQTRRGLDKRLLRYIPLQSIKIVIVAWQILTQFASVANVTYTNIYQRFLDGITVFNFDLSWILTVSCVVDIDFHDRLLFATIGPIVAVVILGVTYAIAALKCRESHDDLANVQEKHVSAVLLLTFLVYSSVSSLLFQGFACDLLDDGTVYLRADYQIQCDSPKHVAFMIYVGFMAILYTLGIPVFYAGLLFKKQHVLANDNEDGESNSVKDARTNNTYVRSTSNLWKPYKPKRFYYEVIECGRRVLLTGVIVFIYPDTAAQVAVTLIIAFTFAMAYERLDPYVSKWDAWVSRMGHIVVFISVFMAMLLKVDISEERSSSQRVFETILVFIHMCLIGAVLCEAFMLVCSIRAEKHEDPFPRFRRMKWVHGRRVGPIERNDVVSERKSRGEAQS